MSPSGANYDAVSIHASNLHTQFPWRSIYYCRKENVVICWNAYYTLINYNESIIKYKFILKAVILYSVIKINKSGLKHGCSLLLPVFNKSQQKYFWHCSRYHVDALLKHGGAFRKLIVCRSTLHRVAKWWHSECNKGSINLKLTVHFHGRLSAEPPKTCSVHNCVYLHWRGYIRNAILTVSLFFIYLTITNNSLYLYSLYRGLTIPQPHKISHPLQACYTRNCSRITLPHTCPVWQHAVKNCTW